MDTLIDDARLLYDQQQRKEDYQLVTGSIKKVNNQWRAESQRRLRGTVSRKTYELDASHSYSQAQDQLQEALAGARNYRRLFACEGLDCGSSSGWANEYLNVKQLYGIDASQYYSVWQFDEGERAGYLVLYLVQRGNRRIYLQKDVVLVASDQSQARGAEVVTQALEQRGHFALPGFSLDAEGAPNIDDETVALLREYLSAHDQEKIRLVGHAYGGNLAVERRTSLLYASHVRDALRAAGVDVNRVSVHGVGSLAPVSASGTARVEVVRW